MPLLSTRSVCLLSVLLLLVAITTSAASPPLSRHPRSSSPTPLSPASVHAEPHAASLSTPFLLLSIEPELPTPGGSVQLQWQCFFCDSLRGHQVVLSNNSSDVIGRALPINGSLVYTIPVTADLSVQQLFTASVEQAQPPLSYSLQVPLRANLQQFALVRPVSTRYHVGQPLPLAWTCLECYTLSSVWLYTIIDDQTQPLLQFPLPLADSGLSIPVPSHLSGDVVIKMVVDNMSSIAATQSIVVDGQYTPPPPPAPAPVPFLALFVEPQIAPPGGMATLSWFCFYCESLIGSGAGVTLETNHSVVLLSHASLNGSLNYTVPTSYAVQDTLGFTASVAGSNVSVNTYSCLLPLRAPVPILKLLRPASSETVSQAAQMELDFRCVECYLLPTVSVTWLTQSRSGGGTLVHGLPVGDSGITLPVPDEMVTAQDVYIAITADLLNTVTDEHFISVQR